MAAPRYRRTRLALIAGVTAAVIGGSAYFSLDGNASTAAQAPIDATTAVTSQVQSASGAQRQPTATPTARRSRGS